MTLNIQRGADGIHLQGELDIAGEQDLMDALEPDLGLGSDVVLNLGQLSFIDSSGVRAFIRAADRVGNGGRIVLRSPSGPVLRVFELMRLDTVPNIEIHKE